MKKFLALLFVCAGLTAMAGVPQISKAQFAQNKAKTMGMMQADSKAMSVQKFFEMKNVTPNDNKLLNKAPRRVAEEDILGSKIAFMLAYSYNEDSAAIVADEVFYYGGWNVALDPQGNGVYNVDLYYNGIPFVINADVANNTAEMVVGPLADGATINFGKDTVSSGGTRPTYTVTTTTAELWLVDEDTFDPSNMTYTNVAGIIYEDDASIYFEKGYGVYAHIHEDIKVYNRNWVLQSSSTNEDSGMITPFFRKTYLMTPSGTHSYVDTYDSSPGENPVYMYQYDDSTAVVWNLFGLGNRGNYMFIYEDGTMHFPNMQYGGDMASQREYCEANYAGYDWTDADHVTFLAYDESTGKPTTGVEYIEGTVTSTSITWPYISWTWWGYDATPGDEGWVYLYIPPFSDNVLTFTNGDKFLLGTVEDPDIEVVEGDEAYTFNGVSEAGATVYLATYDPETMQLIELVENPYVVTRTNEDQIIYLAAYADGYDIGKLSSGWIAFEPFTVPALEGSDYMRGDVNRDGVINIGDVTALINHVLSKDYNDADDFSSENADVTLDGTWNVADVTMLINYVLSKVWPAE